MQGYHNKDWMRILATLLNQMVYISLGVMSSEEIATIKVVNFMRKRQDIYS